MSELARRWSTSYRARLIVGFVLVLGLVTGAWAWSLFGPLTDAVIAQQQEHLQGVAQAGVLVLSQTDRPLDQSVRQLVARTDLRMTVVASDGTVLADSEETTAAMANHATRPEIAEALAGRIGKDTRRSLTQDVEQMYVAVPASYGGERVALRVSESLDRISEISAQTRRTGLVLLGIVLALATIAVVRLTHAAAGPVERLADAARAMADGDLASPVPDERGALAPLSESLRRLREQLRARIGDLETEQRTLRLVLDGLSDAVLLLDGERVELGNRALTSLVRAPQAGVRGRSVRDLGLAESVLVAVTNGIGRTEPATADLGPDPYRRYHRVLTLPLGDSETGPRTLVVITDVTDRMRLDAMRRDFVANASHELKTPTAGISLLAESAGSAVEDGDVDLAVTFLDRIRDETTHLRQLVLDLLDLSRLEAAPAPDSITDVRRAVDLALAGHRRAAAAKDLALVADLGAVDGQDVAARADATDVAVALDNLLANAIAYTEAGSVTVTVNATEREVILKVADTGIGIPAADIERVFERFYRVDPARTRDSGGTGLGLALVRHAAERAGGSVSLTSEEGVGTTVSLTLRRAL
jgi:two-component system phosphate regulon sensor histidine kinase PhoR